MNQNSAATDVAPLTGEEVAWLLRWANANGCTVTLEGERQEPARWYPGDLIELDNESIWLLQHDLSGILIRGAWVPGDMETVLGRARLLHRNNSWAHRDELLARNGDLTAELARYREAASELLTSTEAVDAAAMAIGCYTPTQWERWRHTSRGQQAHNRAVVALQTVAPILAAALGDGE